MILQNVINRIDLYYPNIDKYTDEVKQGLNLPCFFIHCVEATIKREFQDRFWYSCLITVTFIPESDFDGLKKDAFMQNILFALETIPVQESYIRAKNIETKDVDDTLQTVINYDIFVRKVKDRDEFMNKLKQTFHSVKEG